MSESEVQILRTEFKGLENLLTERFTRIDERFENSEKQRQDGFNRIEKHFDEKFAEVNKQLTGLDSRLQSVDGLLRGKNGNPGVNGRSNSAEKIQKLILWIGGIGLAGFFTILAVFVAKYLDLMDQLRNISSAG